MKRLFLLLSLLMVTTTQTIPLQNKPVPKPKPSGLYKLIGAALNKLILKKQNNAATMDALVQKRQRPPVKPKPFTPLERNSRNLAIYLDHEVRTHFEYDSVFSSFIEALSSPDNYAILVSPTLITTLISKYKGHYDLKQASIDGTEEEVLQQKLTAAGKDFKPIQQWYTGEKALIDKYLLENTLRSWKIAKTEHGFYVLLPQRIIKMQHFSTEKLSISQNLYDFLNLSLPSTQTSDTSTFSEEHFLTDLQTFLYSKIIYRSLNVFIKGHGSNEEEYKIAAGLWLSSFKALLHLLSKVNTHSFVYETCFGGGKNTQYTFDTELPYIVIAVGITDTVTCKEFTSNLDLPFYFKNITTDIQKALPYLITIPHDYTQQELALHEFKIRLPHTTWFSLTEMKTRLQPIGEIKARAATLNKEPIVLQGKPCPLSTTALPVLKVPIGEKLPIFIGLVPSTDITLYAIKELILEDTDTPAIFTALDKIFPDDIKSSYPDVFYIKKLTCKNITCKNVVISNENFKLKTSQKIINFNRNINKVDDIIDSKLYQENIKKGEEKLKELDEKAKKFKTHKPHSEFLDFAQLRQDLIEMKPEEFTEDVIQDFKEEFDNNNSLSDAERIILKSTLEAQSYL